MRGLDELMIAAERERLRVGQRLLKAAGQSVHAHESSTLVATLGRTAGLWGQTAVPSRGCGAEDAHTLARGLARKAPQLSRGAVPELEQRTDEFLVVAPAADGILVNRLPHLPVARGPDHPLGPVKLEAARIPREPEKV